MQQGWSPAVGISASYLLGIGTGVFILALFDKYLLIPWWELLEMLP